MWSYLKEGVKYTFSYQPMLMLLAFFISFWLFGALLGTFNVGALIGYVVSSMLFTTLGHKWLKRIRG